MKKSTLNKIFSIIFFVALVFVLGTIYFDASGYESEDFSTTMFSSVDISTLESEAQELIEGRDNNAGIPLAIPTQKMGKTNPFTNPE